MKKQILIVDAYNMIGNWPNLDKLKKSNQLEEARNELLRILSNYHKQSNSEIIVVFDAMFVPGISHSYKEFNLEVVWTDEGQTADSYIEALAGRLQDRLTQVTVATSDQAEQWTIFSQGALRKPAWELFQDIKRANKEVHATARRYQDQNLVRHSPWDNGQLEKLAQLRDDLTTKK
ncbi:NYN domain-containing protein [Ligilactobacillus sp. WILCCON 0076]|uniref:NYN domain-containing protein n=1 Tax=Ligilactobacillus ubinensis TaxID=2876789 RepID=A0A9X2FLQ1_9LACO|nr:NYN domain-containing protein [Ligilactobacillus ubinensis]MCP0887529.1 NYN domain-containing protein [Ligilactobacillus ubinensis]